MDEFYQEGSKSGSHRIITMARRFLLENKNQGSVMRMSGRMSKQTTSSPVRVWKTWIIVEISFLLAVIALFNLFPQLIGIDRSPDAVTEPLPLIAPAFIDTLPWLNLWWGLAIGLNLAAFLFTFRSSKVKWARLAVNLVGLVMLLRLVFAGPIIAFNPVWLSIQTADPSTIALMEKQLAPVLSLAISLSLTVAILALSYSSFTKLRYLLDTRMRFITSKIEGLDRL
jgi:hypothetical protein